MKDNKRQDNQILHGNILEHTHLRLLPLNPPPSKKLSSQEMRNVMTLDANDNFASSVIQNCYRNDISCFYDILKIVFHYISLSKDAIRKWFYFVLVKILIKHMFSTKSCIFCEFNFFQIFFWVNEKINFKGWYQTIMMVGSIFLTW